MTRDPSESDRSATPNKPVPQDNDQLTQYLGLTYKAPSGQRDFASSNSPQPRLTDPSNIGFLLDPTILQSFHNRSVAAPRIADIACGTGAYLADLSAEFAHSHENAALDGFDISSALFRPQDRLPSDVHLHVHDVKQPFPSELHNRYDAVHVRLLVAAMDKDDWEVVTRNVLALLKPGGAIQWEEANFPASKRYRGGGAGTTIDAVVRMFAILQRMLSDKFRYGWSTLPGIFKGLGMANVTSDVVSSDRVAETRQGLAMVSLSAVYSVAKARALVDRQVLEAWNDEAREEIEAGAYNRYDIHVAVGFKKAAGGS